MTISRIIYGSSSSGNDFLVIDSTNKILMQKEPETDLIGRPFATFDTIKKQKSRVYKFKSKFTIKSEEYHVIYYIFVPALDERADSAIVKILDTKNDGELYLLSAIINKIQKSLVVPYLRYDIEHSINSLCAYTSMSKKELITKVKSLFKPVKKSEVLLFFKKKVDKNATMY